MNAKSLLVIFLALSIALPSVALPMATLTTHAASTPVLPSVSSNAQVFEAGATSAVPTYTIENPESGGSITQVSINVPTSLASAVSSSTSAITVTGVPSGTYTTSVYGTGPWTIVISANPGYVLLPPGASIQVSYTFTPITSSNLPSSGTAGAVTPVSVTYSNGNSYTLSSPELYVTAATGYTITAPSSVTAGTNGLFSIQAVAPSGVTVSWVPAYIYVPYPSGAPSSASITYPEVINVSSSQPTYFYVNATYASSYTVYASGGSSSTSAVATGEITTASEPFTVVAGLPTMVTVSLSTDVPGYSTDYATGPVTVTGVSLTDAFGNPVTMPSGTTITLSTSAGLLVSGGSLTWTSPSNTQYGTEISTTLSSSASSVSGPTLYPPVSYGSSSLVSAVITVPSGNSYAGSYSGTSNVVITSTGTLESAVVEPSTLKQTAGKNMEVGLQFEFETYSTASGQTTSVPQPNVPVSFLISDTQPPTFTPPYAATPSMGQVYSNKTGWAVINFVDTNTKDTPIVWVSVPQPVTGAPSSMLYSNTTSVTISSTTTNFGPFTIQPGSPAKLLISVNKYIAVNGSATVTIELADKYGNPASWTQTTPLQVDLSASLGSLSAKTLYIGTSTNLATATYYAPSTTGSATLTATAVYTGIAGASKTVYIVTLNPLLGVTSPANGSVLRTQNITVSAWAVVSPAAPSGTYITTFMYSLYNGSSKPVVSNQTLTVTSTNSSGYNFYNFKVTLSPGKNTLKLYAVDSQGHVSEYTVVYTLSVVPPTPAQTIIFPTSAPPMQTKVAGYNVVNVTVYNNVSTTLTVIPVIVLSNSTYSWVAIGNPTSVAPGQTVVTLVSVQNIPAGTYSAKIFVVTPSGITVSGYKTITVKVS